MRPFIGSHAERKKIGWGSGINKRESLSPRDFAHFWQLVMSSCRRDRSQDNDDEETEKTSFHMTLTSWKQNLMSEPRRCSSFFFSHHGHIEWISFSCLLPVSLMICGGQLMNLACSEFLFPGYDPKIFGYIFRVLLSLVLGTKSCFLSMGLLTEILYMLMFFYGNLPAQFCYFSFLLLMIFKL